MITPMLEESFDMEVVEKHHNQKQDAPSGTAKMLVAAMNREHTYREVHGRNGFVGKRQKEIGIHAVRGGRKKDTGKGVSEGKKAGCFSGL